MSNFKYYNLLLESSNEGHVKMKKEQFHLKYDSEDYSTDVNLGNLSHKIIGVKAIVFNSDDNKKVKLETK